MTGPQQGNQTQYSRLTGQWTYSLTYTLNNVHLYELSTHWGATIDLLSDPQWQVTQSPSPTLAQYTLQGHLINAQWPSWHGFVFQSMIDAQYQVTNGSGQVSLVPGLQISHQSLSFVQVQLGVNISFGEGPGGRGITATFDPQPAASVWFTF